MSETFMMPQVLEVAESLWEQLDCARSLTCCILARYGEWDQLANLKADPSSHIDALDYARTAQAGEFLRKYEALPVSVDVEAVSRDKWEWAERQCFLTNRRFNEILDFGTLNGCTKSADSALEFIDVVRKNVRYLIGDSPNDSILDGRFGPGATVSDAFGELTIPHKLASQPTFTPSAWAYLIPFTGTGWARVCAATGRAPQSFRGDIYFTVSKDSLSKRTCAKSPSINVFYQLAYGQQMRRRLKRRGIDLDDGKAIHMRVACEASKTGSSCTVDLTSASDTVALVMGRLCFPPKWLEPLTDLRCTHTMMPKSAHHNKGWRRLEKFSAMGNGYTFEMETVLFAAITMAVNPGKILGEDIFVYGDDIIAPTETYDLLISALKFFGFTPNPKKCFSTGVFRESCGGDFFDGVPVRAHYLKEEPNEPQQYITLANGIRRFALQASRSDNRRLNLNRTWFRVLDNIPTPIRNCRGPEGLGDLCIHDEESRWAYRWRGSIRWIKVYRPCSFTGVGWDHFGPETQMQAALYGVSLRQLKRTRLGYDNRTVIGRDAVTGYKVGWTPFS